MDGDGAALSPGDDLLLVWLIEQLPRVVFKDTQVLIDNILIQKVVMKLSSGVGLARLSDLFQPGSLCLALLAGHLKFVDVSTPASFDVQGPMHESLVVSLLVVRELAVVAEVTKHVRLCVEIGIAVFT